MVGLPTPSTSCSDNPILGACPGFGLSPGSRPAIGDGANSVGLIFISGWANLLQKSLPIDVSLPKTSVYFDVPILALSNVVGKPFSINTLSATSLALVKSARAFSLSKNGKFFVDSNNCFWFFLNASTVSLANFLSIAPLVNFLVINLDILLSNCAPKATSNVLFDTTFNPAIHGFSPASTLSLNSLAAVLYFSFSYPSLLAFIPISTSPVSRSGALTSP